ncbi:MAG: tRNA (N6-isopentenyl adenosine(37)-C2)-methylthiotransferase MiaB [Proteobacteria bacterium]|nr:tRNA (N6-isopentenyl adenosine(37)-C2)-methylthiotransferase MiaB [Pseudomonadota bacterium]
MEKKFFIRTFGCQMNEYDSEKIADIMTATGDTPSASIEDADIVVFNTCSVREKAQEKLFSDLGRMRPLKEKNPNLMIGVGGCVASQEGEAIIKRVPYVDVVFGPQTLHRLPQLLRARENSGRAQVDITFPEIEKFDHLPATSNDAATAFVSVMEGCSKYCSFCVVPYTRGEEVSRPLDSVLTEIIQLAENGCREVTLLGQNVNAYRVTTDGVLVDFADLLAAVSEVPGIERVRFTTSHPVEFSQRLIDAYAYLPKLPDYLHLPVQSGSDQILARMKRGYTTLEYKSIIRRLRQVRPKMLISSDFIIGFPGESDADFDKTMQLVAQIKFDFSFSFIYSQRPGTPAASFADDTPTAVKKERLTQLQQVLEANGKQYSEAMVGNIEEVLVTGHAKRGKHMLQGRSANTRVVNFAADEKWIGKIVPLSITEATPHSLRGEIVDSAY